MLCVYWAYNVSIILTKAFFRVYWILDDRIMKKNKEVQTYFVGRPLNKADQNTKHLSSVV